MYPFLHSASRLETMRAQVGFKEGSTAHFFEELNDNRRDPLQRENNGRMPHPPDTEWW